MFRWVIDEQASGTKLQVFVREMLKKKYSQRQVKEAISQNFCSVNGRKERFGGFIVGRGDLIEFDPQGLKKQAFQWTFDTKCVLYEDEYLLAYNKPSGVATQDLLAYLKRSVGKLYLVHRLDKDTTGVLLLVKNQQVQPLIDKLFRDRLITKHYLAVVDGIVGSNNGVIESHFSLRKEYDGQKIWGSSKKGRHAVTRWRVICRGNKESLVLCEPVTGRTHQIRIHMYEVGHPLIGDFQYGGPFKSSFYATTFLLHALSLSFIHPINGVNLKISAPLPKCFQDALTILFEDYDENFTC